MDCEGYECRFCLKKMLFEEKIAMIDAEIKTQFFEITQINLELAFEGFSQVVCEVCLRALQLANVYRKMFIENQRKLYEYYQESPKITNNDVNDELSIEDPIMTVKEEKIDEEEIIQEQDNSMKQNDSMEYSAASKYLSMFLSSSTPKKEPNESISNITIQKINNCTYCDKSYTRKDHLRRHINEEHEKIRFQCFVEGCGLEYSRKERLRHHLLSKHRSDLSEEQLNKELEKVKKLEPISDKIRFQCFVEGCTLAYSRKQRLREHIIAKHRSHLTEEQLHQELEKVKKLEPLLVTKDENNSFSQTFVNPFNISQSFSML